MAIDGFSYFDENEYICKLGNCIEEKRPLILRDNEILVGIMAYSSNNNAIEFSAVHPQYKKMGITRLFVSKLRNELLVGKEITVTTFRNNDPADIGQRKEYESVGFIESALLTEYGYPTQLFVLPNKVLETKNGDM